MNFRRYLKTGVLAALVLLVGVVVGAGVGGDLLRSVIAVFSAGADTSEVDATRGRVANELAQNVGQPLGEAREQISYSSAIRCAMLASTLQSEGDGITSFQPDELVTIAANARAIAYNRASLENIQVTQITSDVIRLELEHNAKHGYDSDDEHRTLLRTLDVELRNVCGILRGDRAANP